MQPMYYIGLDVHKRKISYCVKDDSGRFRFLTKTFHGSRIIGPASSPAEDAAGPLGAANLLLTFSGH